MPKITHDSETPSHGQQVLTAAAFIHHEFEGIEKVFLPKRAATKKFLPGVFELPGGHIDFGEEMVTGLNREIKEEFAMQISVGDPFYVFTYENNMKGSHSIEVIYFAQFTSPLDEIVFHPEDHSEFIWLAKDEIAIMLSDLKRKDDPEVKAIERAFALLAGDTLKFA